ncbi:MAG: 50S ribosomal protein L19e [archaeon]
MNLGKKKKLAAKTLGIGKDRIIFNTQRLDEIKEALTKQDIRDLLADGAISIREIKGRHANEKRKTRRRRGSIKKVVNKRKKVYMILTRKLRAYIAELRNKGRMKEEVYWKIRKEIKASSFRSKAHLKERISQ